MNPINQKKKRLNNQRVNSRKKIRLIVQRKEYNTQKLIMMKLQSLRVVFCMKVKRLIIYTLNQRKLM